MLNNSFTAIVFPNPFDVSDKETLTLQTDGKSLSELFTTINTAIAVAVNGEHVTQDRYSEIIPQANDIIIVATLPAGGGDGEDSGGKQVLRLVAIVALTYFTMGAGGLGEAGFFVGNGGALAAGAVFIGGTLLINSLTPSPQMANASVDSGLSSSPSQAYGIDGPKNTSQDGIPVPLVFGKYRVAGNIIASHTENLGREQNYHGLYNFGEGEVADITDVKVNGQMAAEFDSDISIRRGTPSQAVIPEFSDIVTMVPQSITMNGPTDSDDNIHIITTQNDVVRIGLDFTFPQGLYGVKKDGGIINGTIDLQLLYRPVGSISEDDWLFLQTSVSILDTDLPDWTIQPHADLATSGQSLIIVEPYWWGNTKFHQREIVIGEDTDGSDLIGYRDFDQHDFNAGSFKAYPTLVSTITIDDVVSYKAVEYELKAILSGTGEELLVGTCTIGAGGKDNAIKDGNFHLNEYIVGTYRRTVLSPPIPKGRYEIKVARTTAKPDNEDPDRHHTIYDSVKLTDVREYREGKIRYVHTALLGLSVKITNQLNNIPNVTAINHGIKIKTFVRDTSNTNLLKEVFTNSSNPAWIVYNLYINKRWGANHPESRLLMEEFIEWAEFCVANNLEFNGVLDSNMNVWEAVKAVSRVGRATTLPVGTKIGVNIFQAKSPSQLFNNSNIIEGSMNLNWLSLTDRANAIDCVFFDKNNDNIRQEFRIHDTNLLGNGDDRQLRATSMTLFGVSDYQQAAKECVLALNTNKLSQMITFDTFVNGIAVRKGDVINVQHDMPQWGDGGRVVSGTINTVTLDREVEMEAGKEYSLLLTYDVVDLGSASGTARNVGSAIQVNSLPPTETNIIVVNGYGEYKISTIYTVSGSEHHIILEDASFVNGEALTVHYKRTDSMVTRDIEVSAGTFTTLTIKTGQSNFPLTPTALTAYSFGEKNKVVKPFLVTGISGNGIDKRTISALEYSDSTYDDTLTTALPNFSALVNENAHVTNVIAKEKLVGSTTSPRHIVRVSWQYDIARLTQLANVYVAYNNNHTFELFEQGARFDSTIDLTTLSASKLSIRVVALKDDGTEYAAHAAPMITVELVHLINPLPVKNVTEYLDGDDLIVSWEEDKVVATDGDALLRYDIYTATSPLTEGVPDTPRVWKTAQYTDGVVSSYTTDYAELAQTFEKSIIIPDVTIDTRVYVAIVAVNAIDSAKFSAPTFIEYDAPSVLTSRTGSDGIEIWYSDGLTAQDIVDSVLLGNPDTNPDKWSLTPSGSQKYHATITWKNWVEEPWVVRAIERKSDYQRDISGAAIVSAWSNVEAIAAITNTGFTPLAGDSVLLFNNTVGNEFSETRFLDVDLVTWLAADKVYDGNLFVKKTIGADKLIVEEIFALDITATGSITGAVVKTADSGTRAVMSTGAEPLSVYSGETKILGISDAATFFKGPITGIGVIGSMAAFTPDMQALLQSTSNAGETPTGGTQNLYNVAMSSVAMTSRSLTIDPANAANVNISVSLSDAKTRSSATAYTAPQWRIRIRRGAVELHNVIYSGLTETLSEEDSPLSIQSFSFNKDLAIIDTTHGAAIGEAITYTVEITKTGGDSFNCRLDAFSISQPIQGLATVTTTLAALTDTTDFATTPPTDLQVLTWDETSGLWIAADSGGLANLSLGGVNSLTITSDFGYCQIGSLGLNYVHFVTDLPSYWFDKPAYFTTGMYVYGTGTYLTGSDGFIDSNEIWHAGNDGVGSGLNADLLDGYQSSLSNVANTVAVRDVDGDISARLFRSEYDNANATINFIMTQIDTASNNFIRPSTPAQFRAAVIDAYYDKYEKWGVQVEGGVVLDVTSGAAINLVSGTNTSLSRSGNTITINSATFGPFQNGLTGLVPPSANGTLKFLRADGTWVVPYTHPTQSSISVTTANAEVVSSITVNSNGHVISAAKRNISASSLGAYVSGDTVNFADGTFTGSVTASSFIRSSSYKLKNIDYIEDINRSLSDVVAIGSYGVSVGSYKADELQTKHNFFIAENVQLVDNKCVAITDTGDLGVSDGDLLAKAYAAIAALALRIEALENN